MQPPGRHHGGLQIRFSIAEYVYPEGSDQLSRLTSTKPRHPTVS